MVKKPKWLKQHNFVKTQNIYYDTHKMCIRDRANTVPPKFNIGPQRDNILQRLPNKPDRISGKGNRMAQQNKRKQVEQHQNFPG